MRESDLFPPVREWLERQGYTVYVERFDADVIGAKGSELTVVELKLHFGGKLFAQLEDRARWADYVLGAVPIKPDRTDRLKYCGFGLLVVSNGRARQVAKARPQPWDRHKRHDYRLKKLASENPAGPNDLAGLPSCTQLRRQRLANAKPFTSWPEAAVWLYGLVARLTGDQYVNLREDRLVRKALKLTNPDNGGNAEEFKRVQEARRILLGEDTSCHDN